MQDATTYDYIIIGAGAAGLMLADAMGGDVFFQNKTVLLLDKDAKKTNDRTWCFWEKGSGPFDGMLHKTWPHIYFGGKLFSQRFDIFPYTYKMIKGIDFYSQSLKRIVSHGHIRFSQETVVHVQDRGERVLVTTGQGAYWAKQVFNSIFDEGVVTSQQRYPVLRQHFVGWFIKTEESIFDSNQATFMDFSVPQRGNTRFMYVLPFSKNEALVEYTLFSKEVLPKGVYEEALREYISEELNCGAFRIVDSEHGSIPMTCYGFRKGNTQNMLNIGTAGGWAKPSTGYTFMNTAKRIPKLIRHLKSGKPLDTFPSRTKFWYYDLLLLDILHRDNALGHLLFESLFKKRHPKEIFKFLDEETSLWEDLKVISALPPQPFISALLRRLF